MSFYHICFQQFSPTSKFHHSHSSSPRIDPIFTRRNIHFQPNTRSITKSTLWRFILFSDGDLSNHLSILNDYQVKSFSLSKRSIVNNKIETTILIQDHNDSPLVYSSNVWNRQAYLSLIENHEDETLGQIIQRNRLETNRKVQAIHFGTNTQIANLLNISSKSFMWARDYILNRNGKVLMKSHQVFSPRLESILGKISPPPIQHEDYIIDKSKCEKNKIITSMTELISKSVLEGEF